LPHDAFYAALVEIKQRKIPARDPSKDDPGHEISGDDKEYVNTDEPAWYPMLVDMKKDDKHHCDCPKTINVWAVRNRSCHENKLSIKRPEQFA
jgi:hypothetical protein